MIRPMKSGSQARPISRLLQKRSRRVFAAVSKNAAAAFLLCSLVGCSFPLGDFQKRSRRVFGFPFFSTSHIRRETHVGTAAGIDPQQGQRRAPEAVTLRSRNATTCLSSRALGHAPFSKTQPLRFCRFPKNAAVALLPISKNAAAAFLKSLCLPSSCLRVNPLSGKVPA